jgi:HlyD family secretion protein
VLSQVKNKLINNRVVKLIRDHKKISIVLLVILIALIIIFRPKPPAPLETTVVKEGKITEAISATGTVDAVNRVDLVFAAPGKVTYVGAQKGDTVEAGQVIATLDQRTAQKNLENSLRDYAKARNTYEETKDDNGTAANDEVRRILENNQYDLEKAVTSVELQQLAKQNSVLTSPIGGIVIRADVPVAGMNATAASTYTIVDPDSLLFQVEIDNADIGRVRLAQPVNITLDAYPDTPITAAVTAIDFASHKTDTGGNAFFVEVELPLGSHDFRIGMGGDAEIILAEKKKTIVVPIASLEDDRYVYVKNDKGYEKRGVKIGLISDTEAEIITGVEKGEIVSVQPEEAVKQLSKK